MTRISYKLREWMPVRTLFGYLCAHFLDACVHTFVSVWPQVATLLRNHHKLLPLTILTSDLEEALRMIVCV